MMRAKLLTRAELGVTEFHEARNPYACNSIHLILLLLLSLSSIILYDDDDADTNLRHAALSLASSTACCMLLSCSATSSLMHVIHIFRCRPIAIRQRRIRSLLRMNSIRTQ